MAKKASVDEFLERHKAHVGKTQSGEEAVFKGFAAPPSFKKEDRTATFVMSSERIDRDGDIVRQKGLKLDSFGNNPQALLFHSSRSWPIGQWTDIQKRLRTDPPRTEGKLNFAPEGGPIPEIDQAFWAVEQGLIKTVSIGFMPLDLELIEHDEKTKTPYGYGFDIKEADLYECSLVPIPAQPDAVAKGMIAEGKMPAAKEFLEMALCEWAQDPRTGMIVPRKELEKTYLRFFGKQAIVMMGIDSVMPREESALVKMGKIFESQNIKAVTGTDDAIEAVSGIQIRINISQDGGTGPNTRTGEDIGDVGEGATDGNRSLNQNDEDPPVTKTEELVLDPKAFLKDQEPPPPPPVDLEPGHSRPKPKKLLDVLWSRLFGNDQPEETKEPAPPPPNDDPIPGSLAERESRLNKMMARLQAAD